MKETPGGEHHRPPKRPVGQRRSNIEIIADILRAGEHGAGKTEIMYSANMSYTQMQRYLTYLVQQGFISKADMDGGVSAYRVTEDGKDVLRAIDSLLTMLGPDRPKK